MVHDLSLHRSTLLRSSSYGASPVFLSDIGWQRERWGRVVFSKATNENMVISVVGRVLDFCLFVTPNRNWFSDRLESFRHPNIFSFLQSLSIHPWTMIWEHCG